jgi:ZIP family zinc transporter
MFQQLGWALLVSFVVGVIGTGFGGFCVALSCSPSRRALSILLGLSGGVMVSVTCFDIMPEAFRLAGHPVSILWLVIGALMTAATDLITPHIHHMAEDKESLRFARTSLVVGLGIALHNLPEGIAVGAGLGPETVVGMKVAILMFLHNIPEGIAVAGPLRAWGRSRMSLVLFSALAGVPSVIGALLGVSLGSISPVVLGGALAFAGGAMLFVVFDELVPAAQELAYGHSGTVGSVAGIILGMIMSELLGP